MRVGGTKARRVLDADGSISGIGTLILILVPFQVRHADTNALLANLTSENDAVFQVRGIPESTECIALVFAFNEKGRSEPTRVMIQAISPPSKLLTNSEWCSSVHRKNSTTRIK